MIAPSGSMLPVSPLPTGRCVWTASPSTTVCSLTDWDLGMNLLPLGDRGFRRQMGSWGGLAIFTSEGVCVATRALSERGMSS